MNCEHQKGKKQQNFPDIHDYRKSYSCFDHQNQNEGKSFLPPLKYCWREEECTKRARKMKMKSKYALKYLTNTQTF